MTSTRFRFTAERVTQAILIVGFLLVVAANMPGQLSNDSVRQLHEAHVNMRETWAPVVYAAILGFFDKIIPGTGLYLISSIFLFFATLWGVMRTRERVSWFAPVAALILILSPAVMLYQGIVWKDVLFANLAGAGFVLMAHIARTWDPARKPWLALIAMVIALAAAAQVRQNGIIAAVIAAIVLGWTLRTLGWRRATLWAAGLLAAIAAVSQGLSIVCTPKRSLVEGFESQGVRSILQYDILGVAAHDRSIRLLVIAAEDPAKEMAILTYAVPLYAPERIDFISLDAKAEVAMGAVPMKTLERQWIALVLQHPTAYLRHRWDVFSAVFLTPHIDSCLPLFVGVDGPAQALTDLNLKAEIDPVDQKLYNYSSFFLDTPFLSHLAYGLAGLAAIGLLAIRRAPGDFAMAGLVISGLAFAASFFLISIACDYRYIYFLDLASSLAVFYVAIDPPQIRFRPESKR